MERKERIIRENLDFFADLVLDPRVGSSVQGFRNRAKMVVTGSLEAPIIGITGAATEGSLDDGQELLSCPIHHPRLNELLKVLPEFIRVGNLVPYRIGERKGELKGIIAFHSPVSGEIYVRFVFRSKECVSRLQKLVPGLQERVPGLVCVSANIQPIPHAILEGAQEIILTKQAFIHHQLGSLRLRLAPEAFVQTNSEVATKLYETAGYWIREARAEKMLDLFCGQGAFSFFAATGAREGSATNTPMSELEILGVEINADAVNIAESTARELGFACLTFKAADATMVEPEINKFKPDLILANPPRRGLVEALGVIQRQRPAHFIYSSCSIDTLAADLKKLAGDYRLRRAQLFDMFPHTPHFETLVWLERIS